MSLDIYLRIGDTVVYSANITHNLIDMAKAAGIYRPLWRPAYGTRAKDLVDQLSAAVTEMVLNQKHFDAFNSPNGWGKWENFLPWCARLLQACRDNPEAIVEVSR